MTTPPTGRGRSRTDSPPRATTSPSITATSRRGSALPTSRASASRWRPARNTSPRSTRISPTTPRISRGCSGGAGGGGGRGASTCARTFLGVEVRDLTGGFKVFRREVLEALDLDDVQARGYAFQVELTYRALELGFKEVEVPITFRDS